MIQKRLDRDDSKKTFRVRLIKDEENRRAVLILSGLGSASEGERFNLFILGDREQGIRGELDEGLWDLIIDLELLSSIRSRIQGTLSSLYHEHKKSSVVFACGSQLNDPGFKGKITSPLIEVQGVSKEDFVGSLETVLGSSDFPEELRDQALSAKAEIGKVEAFSPEVDAMRSALGKAEIGFEVVKGVLAESKKLRAGALQVKIKGEGDNLLILTKPAHQSAVIIWLREVLDKKYRFFDQSGKGQRKVGSDMLAYIVEELFSNSQKSYGGSERGIIFVYLLKVKNLLYLIWEDHGGLASYQPGSGTAHAHIHDAIVKMYLPEEVRQNALGLKTDAGMTKPEVPKESIDQRLAVAKSLLEPKEAELGVEPIGPGFRVILKFLLPQA